jgi:hypothetical protein
MMSAASEGAKRVAEIPREILALLGTKRLNDLKSAITDRFKYSRPTASTALHQTCAPWGKQPGNKRSKSEDQDSLC